MLEEKEHYWNEKKPHNIIVSLILYMNEYFAK